MWLMTLPRVRPIIPTWRKEPFDNPDWLFELKYDSFRALLYLEKGKGRFIPHSSDEVPILSELATFLG
jgi:ATP-dependent DNA ligase